MDDTQLGIGTGFYWERVYLLMQGCSAGACRCWGCRCCKGVRSYTVRGAIVWLLRKLLSAGLAGWACMAHGRGTTSDPLVIPL